MRNGARIADRAELVDWYRQCVIAYSDAVKAVDPTVKLVIDGEMDGLGNQDELFAQVFADPALRARFDLFTLHLYAPKGVREVKRDGQAMPPSEVPHDELWNALVAMPGSYDGAGLCQGLDPRRVKRLRDLGCTVACTEWNWNGWWLAPKEHKSEWDNLQAAGIGAAGFLNGLMRQGSDVTLATQSMLIGSSWGITAIRVDPAITRAPYLLPQGVVASLYAQHHGTVVLASELSPQPWFAQPYRINMVEPMERVAALDVVVGAAADAVFLHLVNRSFAKPFIVRWSAGTVADLGGAGQAWTWQADPHRPCGAAALDPVVRADSIPVTGNAVEMNVPAHAVMIVRLPVSAFRGVEP